VARSQGRKGAHWPFAVHDFSQRAEPGFVHFWKMKRGLTLIMLVSGCFAWIVATSFRNSVLSSQSSPQLSSVSCQTQTIGSGFLIRRSLKSMLTSIV
jgi:hypothetical protein